MDYESNLFCVAKFDKISYKSYTHSSQPTALATNPATRRTSSANTLATNVSLSSIESRVRTLIPKCLVCVYENKLWIFHPSSPATTSSFTNSSTSPFNASNDTFKLVSEEVSKAGLVECESDRLLVSSVPTSISSTSSIPNNSNEDQAPPAYFPFILAVKSFYFSSLCSSSQPTTNNDNSNTQNNLPNNNSLNTFIPLGSSLLNTQTSTLLDIQPCLLNNGELVVRAYYKGSGIVSLSSYISSSLSLLNSNSSSNNNRFNLDQLNGTTVYVAPVSVPAQLVSISSHPSLTPLPSLSSFSSPSLSSSTKSTNTLLDESTFLQTVESTCGITLPSLSQLIPKNDQSINGSQTSNITSDVSWATLRISRNNTNAINTSSNSNNDSEITISWPTHLLFINTSSLPTTFSSFASSSLDPLFYFNSPDMLTTLESQMSELRSLLAAEPSFQNQIGGQVGGQLGHLRTKSNSSIYPTPPDPTKLHPNNHNFSHSHSHSHTSNPTTPSTNQTQSTNTGAGTSTNANTGLDQSGWTNDDNTWGNDDDLFGDIEDQEEVTEADFNFFDEQTSAAENKNGGTRGGSGNSGGVDFFGDEEDMFKRGFSIQQDQDGILGGTGVGAGLEQKRKKMRIENEEYSINIKKEETQDGKANGLNIKTKFKPFEYNFLENGDGNSFSNNSKSSHHNNTNHRGNSDSKGSDDGNDTFSALRFNSSICDELDSKYTRGGRYYVKPDSDNENGNESSDSDDSDDDNSSLGNNHKKYVDSNENGKDTDRDGDRKMSTEVSDESIDDGDDGFGDFRDFKGFGKFDTGYEDFDGFGGFDDNESSGFEEKESQHRNESMLLSQRPTKSIPKPKQQKKVKLEKDTKSKVKEMVKSTTEHQNGTVASWLTTFSLSSIIKAESIPSASSFSQHRSSPNSSFCSLSKSEVLYNSLQASKSLKSTSASRLSSAAAAAKRNQLTLIEQSTVAQLVDQLVWDSGFYSSSLFLAAAEYQMPGDKLVQLFSLSPYSQANSSSSVDTNTNTSTTTTTTNMPKTLASYLPPPSYTLSRMSLPLQAHPTILRFWHVFGLSPKSGPKNVQLIPVMPNSQHVFKSWLLFADMLRTCYAGCGYGELGIMKLEQTQRAASGSGGYGNSFGIGASQSSLENGIVPVTLSAPRNGNSNGSTVDQILEAMESAITGLAQDLASSLSQFNSQNSNNNNNNNNGHNKQHFALIVLNPVNTVAAVARLSFAFSVLVNHPALRDLCTCSNSNSNSTSHTCLPCSITLKIVPIDFIVASETLATPSQMKIVRVALNIYNMLGSSSSVVPSQPQSFSSNTMQSQPQSLIATPPYTPPSQAFHLAKAQPSRINYTYRSTSSLLAVSQNLTYLHIAYTVSADKRWVVVAWSDEVSKVCKVEAIDMVTVFDTSTDRGDCTNGNGKEEVNNNNNGNTDNTSNDSNDDNDNRLGTLRIKSWKEVMTSIWKTTMGIVASRSDVLNWQVTISKVVCSFSSSPSTTSTTCNSAVRNQNGNGYKFGGDKADISDLVSEALDTLNAKLLKIDVDPFALTPEEADGWLELGETAFEATKIESSSSNNDNNNNNNNNNNNSNNNGFNSPSTNNNGNGNGKDNSDSSKPRLTQAQYLVFAGLAGTISKMSVLEVNLATPTIIQNLKVGSFNPSSNSRATSNNGADTGSAGISNSQMNQVQQAKPLDGIAKNGQKSGTDNAGSGGSSGEEGLSLVDEEDCVYAIIPSDDKGSDNGSGDNGNNGDSIRREGFVYNFPMSSPLITTLTTMLNPHSFSPNSSGPCNPNSMTGSHTTTPFLNLHKFGNAVTCFLVKSQISNTTANTNRAHSLTTPSTNPQQVQKVVQVTLCKQAQFNLPKANNNVHAFHTQPGPNRSSPDSSRSTTQEAHEILQQFRNLASFGEATGIVLKQDCLVPWHVGAVEKVKRVLMEIN